MSFGRVIQDSDEDEEPFEEPPRERTNRAPVVNDKMQHDADIQAQDANHDSHIGVDFDSFLQSQNDPQTNLSASQQRREERWIPSTEHTGSSGNMTAEIGLAQQRLFDDDQQAQFPPQQIINYEPEQRQDDNYALAAPDDITEAHELSNLLAKDLSSRTEPHGADISDWSQTASYNIFDSSSHTTRSLLNRADLICDPDIKTRVEAMQNFELRRWTTMQGGTSSPHDTEPFSSIISPRVTRAKSDNATLNDVQPSSASVDELSLPVTMETPKVERRGYKKQAVVANDEDDELSIPQVPELPPAKPEKRKPGRPPKRAKVDDTVNTSPITRPADIPPEENQGPAVPDAPGGITVDVAPPQSITDEFMRDNQSKQPGMLVLEQSLQTPTTSTKEPKKKKLKRGKTTSVTLTKTYDPDVEDDVIWVEQRPATPTYDDNKPSNPTEQSDNTVAEQTTAPKKRGRKRKKTSEQLDQEASAPLAVDEQDAQTTTFNAADNTPQLNDTHNDSGVLVVLETKKATGAQTSDLTESITKEDQAPLDLHPPASPAKPSEQAQPTQQTPETPQKRTDPNTPSVKGPGKHSPISSTSKVPYRVGLSKKARIAPLLKIIKR
ncbi:hypothetical protein BDW72DRAFT_192354 [Aspergillus terricola var. indicus]